MRRYTGRAHVREKVDIAARLIMGGERFIIIPCRIVDRSDGGMKVEMKVSHPLPNKIFLLGDNSEDLYECETRWQNEEMAGLMLIDLCLRSKRKEILAKAEEALTLEPQEDEEPAADET